MICDRGLTCVLVMIDKLSLLGWLVFDNPLMVVCNDRTVVIVRVAMLHNMLMSRVRAMVVWVIVLHNM